VLDPIRGRKNKRVPHHGKAKSRRETEGTYLTLGCFCVVFGTMCFLGVFFGFFFLGFLLVFVVGLGIPLLKI